MSKKMIAIMKKEFARFFGGLGSYSSYNDIYDHIYDDIYDDIEDSMDDGTI